MKQKLKIIVDSGFNEDYKKFLEIKYDLEVLNFSDISDKKSKINLTKIDMLVFTGGADVNPNLYNEPIGKHTSINSKRDDIEQDMFYIFDYIPKLGICRGAQFLTVMSGGKLIQHVEGHTSSHSIHLKPTAGSLRFLDSKEVVEYDITSTHHQMMFPFNLDKSNYKLISWSKRFKSNTYLNGFNEEIKLPDNFLEPEIVYYNKTNSLCVQGHPEFKNCSIETKKLVLLLIDKHLVNNNESKLIKDYNEW